MAIKHDVTTSKERIPVRVHPSSGEASREVAGQIAELIGRRAAEGRRAVIGLATGSTPVGVYDELVRLHREKGLSFANVVTFNLDEYWPMNPEELQSYRRFMQEHLFDHVDIEPGNAHVPDGTATREQLESVCEAYEKSIAMAGGIDLQLLGIGRTGHIGFNEPGSPRDSRTRVITLDRVTRMDAASDFFGELHVPRQAITMGVGSILAARRVVLLAFGEHKAPVVRRAVEEEATPSIAASFLQQHPDATFVLDPAAAAELTRFKTPWQLGPVASQGLTWDEALTRRAAVWLCGQVDKPILKLTDEDYNEHGLQELLATHGGAYNINIEVFRAMQRTIVGWPGGKRGRPRFVAGKGVAPENGPDEFPKRIVIFSPHPDDDVISMGGTLIRLCDQGHEVHVAYQTSGNLAVWDEEAIRHADFVTEFARGFDLFSAAQIREIESKVNAFVRAKKSGEIDSPELQRIKSLIRRTEARAGARVAGVATERIHFLDMPFYETGKVRKKPLSPEDIRIVADLIRTVRPHQIYAAGDLSDPHGTHRVCLSAVLHAVEQLRNGTGMTDCDLWLYRGAWQEWDPHDIDMAVPLSPSEVDRKRTAIFKHQSQKDKALFPGPNDPREFWQRSEDRNRRTAEAYDGLGLPEYQAIEGFVLWRRDKHGLTL